MISAQEALKIVQSYDIMNEDEIFVDILKDIEEFIKKEASARKYQTDYFPKHTYLKEYPHKFKKLLNEWGYWVRINRDNDGYNTVRSITIGWKKNET